MTNGRKIALRDGIRALQARSRTAGSGRIQEIAQDAVAEGAENELARGMDLVNESVSHVIDTDGDGIPDHLDRDDDNDGVLDEHDAAPKDSDVS